MKSWFADTEALRQQWTQAKPFPYLLVDDLLPKPAQEELLAAFDDEPCDLLRDEIFEFLVSAKSPRASAIQAFREELGSQTVRDALSQVTGLSLSRLELRAYAYQPGHYLLPHSDHQAEQGRKLAMAYYLSAPWKIEGGELELFSCEYQNEDLIKTTSAAIIAPHPNRLVIFHVGDTSLHQVREVLSGTRLSISGWFF
jgi:Rps23 Pro-64 3,4-dihydroxylase Tpa1-like proline 4-hydroxylase